jgi:hypothetical protein
VDHEVLTVFGIDKMFVAVIGGLEKIGDDVFEVFFAFAARVSEVFQQSGEFGLERFQAARSTFWTR